MQALNYPSVATRLVGLNVCLPPSVADLHFQPGEAWMLKFEERVDRLEGVKEDGPFYRTTFLRRSETIRADGRIQWSGILSGVQPQDIAHLAYRPRLPV